MVHGVQGIVAIPLVQEATDRRILVHAQIVPFLPHQATEEDRRRHGALLAGLETKNFQATPLYMLPQQAFLFTHTLCFCFFASLLLRPSFIIALPGTIFHFSFEYAIKPKCQSCLENNEQKMCSAPSSDWTPQVTHFLHHTTLCQQDRQTTLRFRGLYTLMFIKRRDKSLSKPEMSGH